MSSSIEDINNWLLPLIPQQAPFRFIDRVLEVDDDRIAGQYTFKEDEFFYKGHFPENPITPGVILIECMAQIGVVAFALYLLNKERSSFGENAVTLFSDVEVEFVKPIFPGETVTVKSEKIFWRRGKLKSKIELFKADGSLACAGTLSGMGKVIDG